MKKYLFLIILALFISFSSEIGAQSITLIPNPDTCGGVGDYDSGFYPIVFNNALYFEYADSIMQESTHYYLAKYDGSNVTIIANPDNGYGFSEASNPFVFNNNLFFIYTNSFNINQLAKFDGSNITPIPNPDNGEVRDNLMEFNNALYFRYSNQSYQKWQLAKYDGTSVTLIQNPDNGYGVASFNFVNFNNELYLTYRNSSGQFQLAKYNGANIVLIPNPNTASNNQGVGRTHIVFDNKIFFVYSGYGIGQLAKYDGSNITVLPNPGNGAIYLGDMCHVIYNNELYFIYEYSLSKYQLAKYNGSNFTLIPNPTNSEGILGSDLVVYDNAIYFQYVGNEYFKDQLAKYDGTNITLIANPETTGGLGGYSAGQYFIIFNNELFFNYHDSSTYHLAKFDGINITLIPNPDSGFGVCRLYHGDIAFRQIIYNNALYFPYTSILNPDSSYKIQLAKYSGTNSIYEQGINNIINIYPNPANDNLIIEQLNEQKNSSIEIFNTNGQLLILQNIQNPKTAIDIKTLSKGMYFIKVKTENEITTKKFIKE